MVVLVIIAVMAAVVVPNVIDRPDRARVTVAVTDLRAIASVQALNRAYSTTAQGLSALVERHVSAPVPANWAAGGSLEQMQVDPWDTP